MKQGIPWHADSCAFHLRRGMPGRLLKRNALILQGWFLKILDILLKRPVEPTVEPFFFFLVSQGERRNNDWVKHLQISANGFW